MCSGGDLEGRHVLVTGASSGLGLHFARLLAERGADVTLAARRLGQLEEALDGIRANGGKGGAVAMDVTSAGNITEAFVTAQQRAGPVRILINNAGVALTRSAVDVEEADWEMVVGTNLKGAWLAAREAARRLIAASTGGAIVNIASILGLRVAGGVAPYAIAKAAVIQMTKALALELARHSIRVNALAPGYIETDLNRDFFATDAGQAIIRRIPQRRLGQPGDLDAPLLLLASDASSYMTGAVLVVDGGHLVSSL
jgi:NAD(P)-dependent dehydrogenase (short-subunit alcohol dehydrogenase family)